MAPNNRNDFGSANISQLIEFNNMEKPPTPTAHPLVLFDGDCNFCNRSVRFILDHEKDHTIRFAAASSATGQRALNLNGLSSRPGSIVFIDGDQCFTQSTATLQITRHLRLPWR